MKIATHWGSVITKLGIGCVVCLLLGVALLLSAQEEKKAEFIGTMPKMDAAKMKEMAARMQAANRGSERSQPERNNAWGRQNRGGGGVDFGENEAFYKTIIEYNLFRPLGWTPPNNEPEYSLVGTAVDRNGAVSQATLLERRSNRYHFVTIGSKLDDMTVTEIQDKKIIFDKEGETVTLNTGSFQPLTSRRGNDGGGGRGDGDSERASNNNSGQNRARQMETEKRRQAEEKKREYSREQMRREAMEKLRNASSSEERREIIEWMRKEFGGDRGRRGRDR